MNQAGHTDARLGRTTWTFRCTWRHDEFGTRQNEWMSQRQWSGRWRWWGMEELASWRPWSWLLWWTGCWRWTCGYACLPSPLSNPSHIFGSARGYGPKVTVSITIACGEKDEENLSKKKDVQEITDVVQRMDQGRKRMVVWWSVCRWWRPKLLWKIGAISFELSEPRRERSEMFGQDEGHASDWVAHQWKRVTWHKSSTETTSSRRRVEKKLWWRGGHPWSEKSSGRHDEKKLPKRREIHKGNREKDWESPQTKCRTCLCQTQPKRRTSWVTGTWFSLQPHCTGAEHSTKKWQRSGWRPRIQSTRRKTGEVVILWVWSVGVRIDVRDLRVTQRSTGCNKRSVPHKYWDVISGVSHNRHHTVDSADRHDYAHRRHTDSSAFLSPSEDSPLQIVMSLTSLLIAQMPLIVFVSWKSYLFHWRFIDANPHVHRPDITVHMQIEWRVILKTPERVALLPLRTTTLQSTQFSTWKWGSWLHSRTWTWCFDKCLRVLWSGSFCSPCLWIALLSLKQSHWVHRCAPLSRW